MEFYKSFINKRIFSFYFQDENLIPLLVKKIESFGISSDAHRIIDVTGVCIVNDRNEDDYAYCYMDSYEVEKTQEYLYFAGG